MNNIKISKNFNLKEFECKGNGEVKLHSKLLELLQSVRDEFDKPIKINSGYRSKEHNERVGGAKRSQHLRGTAVDISIRNLDFTDRKVATVVRQLADEIGIGRDNLGIGYGGTFLHIDVRGLIGDRSPVEWNY